MTLPPCDYLVTESTYGDRRHEPVDPGQALADVITRTAARGGTVVHMLKRLPDGTSRGR